MRLARVGWLAVAIASSTGSALADALPLQELTTHAVGRVAHLSVRDAHDEEESSGTGFVISSDGRVATNYHVIDGAHRIVAVFPDKKSVKVTGVWAFDKKVDIAVLQLEAGKYDALDLAKAPAVTGEEIVVIGSPLGLSNSISTGIVSAVRDKGLESTANRDGEANWSLQITAAAAPGSSGWPILRANGDVVGVLVGHLRGLDGMYFGIAVEQLRLVAASAPAKPAALSVALGERSTSSNLLISGAFFAAIAAIWLVVSKVRMWPRGRRKR